MMFRIRLNVQPLSPGVVARCGETLAADGTTIPLWRNGGGFDVRIAGTDYPNAGAWALGEWYEITLVSGAGGISMWANGQIVLSGSMPANASLPQYLGFGRPEGGGGGADWFDIEYAIICSRALESRAAQDFHENPYQLFRVDPIRIYSFPSGPIIPALSGLTTTNITQSGARHSLTLTF